MMNEIRDAVEENTETVQRLRGTLNRLETVMWNLLWSMVFVGVINVLTLIAVAWLVL